MSAWIYVLRFSRPLGNPDGHQANYYLGSTDSLQRRILEHENGRGAAIVRAAVERGARIELAACWEMPDLETARRVERRLKGWKSHRRVLERFKGGALCS